MKPTLPLLALLAAASAGAQTNQWLHTADNPASLPAFPEWNMTNRDKATVLSTLRHEWELEAVERLWTLTYTTNVVESDNHQGCQYYAKDVIIWPVPSDYGPYTPPTERTWTTNVTEHLVVTLRVNGEDRTLEQSRVVSSRSYTERLESKWVAAQVQELSNRSYSFTNFLATNSHGAWLVLTNGDTRAYWLRTNAYPMESLK